MDDDCSETWHAVSASELMEMLRKCDEEYRRKMASTAFWGMVVCSLGVVAVLIKLGVLIWAVWTGRLG